MFNRFLGFSRAVPDVMFKYRWNSWIASVNLRVFPEWRSYSGAVAVHTEVFIHDSDCAWAV